MDFHILNHPCITGMKPTWDDHGECFFNMFGSIFLFFASVFIREIDLKFSFSDESLCSLGIKVTINSFCLTIILLFLFYGIV